MITLPPSTSVSNMVNTNDLALGQGDPGLYGSPTRPVFTDEQISQFTIGGARPRARQFHPPAGHQEPNRSSQLSRVSAGTTEETESQSSASSPSRDQSEHLSSGLFGPSFLQGFFVNCSACRQTNKANAKCYECNKYLCEKCVYAHAKSRQTNFHHIYHFDSLAEVAERLAPTVTGVLTQQASDTASNQDLSLDLHNSTNNDDDTNGFTSHASSRVVGAGRRRSSGENSHDSSRTSSINLPSPTDSRRASNEALSSVQAAIKSISLSIGNSSSSGIFSPLSPLSYNSGTPSPRPCHSPRPIGSPPIHQQPPDISYANHQNAAMTLPHSTSHNAAMTLTANQNAAAAMSQSPNQIVPMSMSNLPPTNQSAFLSNWNHTVVNRDEVGAAVAPMPSLGDAGDASMALVLSQQFEMGPCARHQTDFRFFCKECMIPICSVCLQEKHMDHSLVYITEALQRVGQMSHELNSQIRELNQGLRQALDGLQRMCEGIDYRAHQVAIDVKCTIRRFITALEARQDDILQRIEQARQVKLRLINFQMENVRLYYSKLARALDLINDPSRFTNPIENMAANHQAFRELRLARNLGPHIFPCEDDGFTFVTPSESHLQSIALLGNLHISSAPITNSVALCRQPLLYINSRVQIPEFPLPAAKSRPIYGCREIVAVKDFGRMPKMIWGKGGPEDGELCRPWGITMNRFGQIIIADRSNNRIQVFDSEGRYLFQFGNHGSRNGQFDRPAAVAVSPNDDMVVADKDNHRVQVFNRNGEFLFTFGEKGSLIGQFMYPWDVACDSMGNILVSDARNHRVQLFRWNGVFIAKWGGELSQPRLFDTPRGVAFDPAGNILMTDFNMHRVVMIERMTGKVKFVGREGRERGQFNRPQGICCDDRGWFVVADSRNYRFQVFNEKGEFMWMVGRQGKEDPGEFDRPCDVCIDPEGHIHLMDFGNDRIQVF